VIRLDFNKTLPFMDAMSLIIDLALYSNYYPHGCPPFRSIADVAGYLEQRGLTLPECAEQSRDYSEKPKYFYNLIGPTWNTKGVSVSRPDPKTGEQRTIISGDGQYNTANYWAKFEQSLSNFERAMAESNHELLLSAFAKGQAAIENFLNALNIEGIEKASVEGKLKKVFLAVRPNGNWDTERENQPWSSFILMKKIRNDHEIHNKSDASGFTYPEIHSHFNLYVPAVAKTLFELHKMLNIKCPASIVRSSYHPELTMDVVDDA
jgi:hypothetical protein